MSDNIAKEVWDHEIMTMMEPAADWLWHGYVAKGNLTLLTGMGKAAGKTTLLSLMLARRKRGGTLAGLEVRPGKTVVVTEENSAKWGERARQYDFGSQVCFFPRPFLGIPGPEEWQGLISRILRLKEEHGIDLAVIDPLAPFLRNESNSRTILETLLPLTALTRRGMAVLAMHHPSKSQTELGLAVRGSSALLGHVDISVEMRHSGGDPESRRRRLLALSRHSETPRQLLIELNPEGADYSVVSDAPQEDGFEINWEVLRMVLEDAPQKLTRLDILGEWPADFDKPSVSNLGKWLARAVQRGLIAVEGSGRRADPFRYWLPEREAVWKENPLYEFLEQQKRDLKLTFRSLDETKRLDREDRRLEGGFGAEEDREG